MKAAVRKNRKASNIVPIEDVRTKLEADGFCLVRGRCKMDRNRPENSPEIWCDGASVAVVRLGKSHPATLHEALELMRTELRTEFDSDSDLEGEGKWIEFIRSHLILPLSQVERAAVALGAANMDMNITSYAKASLLNFVGLDLDEVRAQLKEEVAL